MRNHIQKSIAMRLVRVGGVMALMGALTACQTLEAMSNGAAADVKPIPVRSARASMIAPIVETRETITATGYAVVSIQNHKTPAQKRLLAIRASKLDAYRALTEQVYGQHLDATTTVADMTVMSDTFRTRVEGVIYGAVLVSITPAGDDTYETTLSLDARVVDDLRALYLGQLASNIR
jgi:outer membrane protein FlgP